MNFYSYTGVGVLQSLLGFVRAIMGVAVCLLWVCACGGGGNSETDTPCNSQPRATDRCSPNPTLNPSPTLPPSEPPSEPPSLPTVAESRALANALSAELVESLTGIDCPSAANTPSCERLEIKFSDGQFNGDNLDETQTILIIDDIGLEFPAILRYRSRVREALHLSPEGRFQAYDMNITVPRYLVETLQAVDALQTPDAMPVYTPASWWGDVRVSLENIDPNLGSEFSPNHGDMPFLYLLDKNPRASFVIVTLDSVFDVVAAQFCENDHIGLELAYRDMADSLAAEMQQHGVNYVSWSGGITTHTVAAAWQRLCATALPAPADQRQIVQTLRPLFQLLFATDAVMSFQASDINMNLETHPFETEFSAFPNRVLVADYTELDSNLPADGVVGSDPTPVAAPSRQNSRQWIDLFINVGVEERRPFPTNNTPLMESDIYGLDSFAITSLQPSWVTPVALSRAIHLKASRYPEEALDGDLIREIKQNLSPAGCFANPETDANLCKFQDPLLHCQQEIFRLGFEVNEFCR